MHLYCSCICLWFLMLLLQQLETHVACVLAEEPKNGSAMNRVPPLWLYPGWNPPCSPTSADTISGKLLSFHFCLTLSWSSWKQNPVFCSMYLRGQENLHQCLLSAVHFLAPGNPTPLLAVGFLCQIRCSSKQRTSFVCSNTLMTKQSILLLVYYKLRKCLLPFETRLLQVVG